ncbi:biotin/lipoyl-binding protein [Trichloromonas sp.]|uniref:biotin/lipoyl-binding protein n=1 Tax=Trichloromonas sp. TaxID=3069249 RepID=UPI003D815974
MSTAGKTFSESWHRVADLRVSLRPTVRIRKQWFRGEQWYVLHDPFNNTFFRLRPEAHQLAIRLHPGRTVSEVWADCLARDADGAPGQEDVIQLLGQLYAANLLFCDLPADSARLFERYADRRQREIRSTFLNLMFFRVPLIDPEKLLRRLSPLIHWMTGRVAAGLWLLLILLAGMTVIGHADALASETRNLLEFDNLVLLYGGLVLVKIWHECGHAMVCHRFGGEVHTMGVMLMVFTPLPYMDATSSWSFRSRRQRILVGAAGMIFELFAACCAALLWANTGPGALHSLAFNMMFVASVSTLVFNANPLLRYDGYYILSDLIDIPNLQSRSLAQLKYLGERYLFGGRDNSSPAHSRSETAWLSGYGILSGIYRVVVYGGIILFVADRFLLAGLIMAVVCIFSWGVRPMANFARYLATSPKLAKTRPRAIAITLTGLSLGLLLLAVVPVPSGFRAPGVLEAKTYLRVANDTPGQLVEILAPSGVPVEPGQPLLRLENPELNLEIKMVSAQLTELLALRKQSLASEGDAESALLKKRLEALEQRLQRLGQRQQSLVVSAREAGTWVAPESRELLGTWLSRGAPLGVILSPAAFRFSAVVSQEEAANLFAGNIRGEAEVRLSGQGGLSLRVDSYEFIPFQHEKLPSAALGWLAGGEVPVSGKDSSGLQTVEPFFQIYAELAPLEGTALYHGQSGQVRFSLHGEPLLTQWARKLRQLLQRRYQT